MYILKTTTATISSHLQHWSVKNDRLIFNLEFDYFLNIYHLCECPSDSWVQ